ncbi:MAG: response regulator, partial [Chloroflexi bacterium]|nr:response regulator [Chloroflexota bacterium]
MDDDPDILALLEQVLEDAGFDVTSASNGEQALERLGPELPSAVVLDLMMPVMD